MTLLRITDNKSGFQFFKISWGNIPHTPLKNNSFTFYKKYFSCFLKSYKRKPWIKPVWTFLNKKHLKHNIIHTTFKAHTCNISTHLAIPCCTACLCISSRALSSSSSFRSCSIFFDSASAFCSAFHTLSTFRSVWGCQLFFKFCLK